MSIRIPRRTADAEARHATVVPVRLPESFLSVKQAARYAAVSQPTVRRWIRGKLLRVYRAGSQIRIDRADLVYFLRGGDQQ